MLARLRQWRCNHGDLLIFPINGDYTQATLNPVWKKYYTSYIYKSGTAKDETPYLEEYICKRCGERKTVYLYNSYIITEGNDD